MPGRIVTSGMKILGKAPMIGVIRAEFRSLAANARCTSAKLVVQ